MSTRVRLPPVELGRVVALARTLGVRELTARLLLNRGVTDEESARRFLDPRLSRLRRPEEDERTMAGFSRAVSRLCAAIVDGETIGLFGDYDVDGVTTCAVLARFLGWAGASTVAKVASRDQGYGFSVEAAERMADAGCKVVVTGDCGTSDHEALAHARGRGIDVIVVDHHQVPDRDPGAYALINPHQASCRFPFKGLASVGVAFYLAAALSTRLRAERPERYATLPDPRRLLDLVALGTIADLVPLTDENRALVAAGLKELSSSPSPGTRALLKEAGLSSGGRALTAQDVGFKIGPLLNAPGRLGEAQLALDLLLAASDEEARQRAAVCGEANRKRREIQEQVNASACAALDALGDGRSGAGATADDARVMAHLGRVVVVAGVGFHAGVVGIVAAKLTERYHRPSVVIALPADGGSGRGSGRVPRGSGFHLYKALSACGEHLVRYGGHGAAAGLSVEAGRVRGFMAAFEAAYEAGAEPGAAEGRQPVAADAEVTLEEIDEALIHELARLGPFGMSNPEPLLLARALYVDRTRVVGEKHLQITVRQGDRVCDGIAFNLAPSDPGAGARVELLFVPEVDTFRGLRRLRLRVEHLGERIAESFAEPAAAPVDALAVGQLAAIESTAAAASTVGEVSRG